MLGGLNYPAVIIAAIVSFVFGGIWYNALSKQWMDAVGIAPDRAPRDRGGLGLYVLTFAAQLIMAWMLAGLLLHLERGGIPLTPRNAVISAAFVWFGFVITTMVVNYAFHGAKQVLTLIDGVHWLCVLLLQGLVIGWWGAH